MILAWIGAAIVGLSLGLLGSGGSILTVPVLIYLAAQHGKVAIAESLVIVGTIALFGALPYALRGITYWRHVWLFGIPGMVGSYLGAYLARFMPVALQLALFAVIMLAAGFSMLKSKRSNSRNRTHATFLLGSYGLGVGIITGLVGVGGGFLIVPALVLLGDLPMINAIGSSLWIIAMNSATGFYKYLEVLEHLHLSLHWEIIGVFAAIGIVGSFAGNAICTQLSQAALKRYFAYFLFVMGIFILIKNLPQLWH